MRLSSAILLVLTLGACATAPPAGQPARETRVIDSTDLGADRILAEAALCGYPGVTKILGPAAQATVTIVVARADPRYQCLVQAMAAKGEDEPKRKPPPAP